MNGFIQRMLSTSFSIYLTLCGALMVALSLFLLSRRARIHLGLRAQGQIIGYHQRMRQGAAMTPQYMPIIRFQPRAGPPVEFQSRMNADPRRWPEGTLLPVAYRANRPTQAEIATAIRLWLAPAAIFLFGATLGAVAWQAG